MGKESLEGGRRRKETISKMERKRQMGRHACRRIHRGWGVVLGRACKYFLAAKDSGDVQSCLGAACAQALDQDRKENKNTMKYYIKTIQKKKQQPYSGICYAGYIPSLFIFYIS